MRMVTGGGPEPFTTVDLSGPTACSIDPPEVRAAIIARLGPDPLRRDAKPAVAIERMARSRQPIGALLLDQSVIAGVGNVFRAEALFVNRIDPRRAVGEAALRARHAHRPADEEPRLVLGQAVNGVAFRHGGDATGTVRGG